jgi:hypothetical protein
MKVKRFLCRKQLKNPLVTANKAAVVEEAVLAGRRVYEQRTAP